jgi:hypothetical protein
MGRHFAAGQHKPHHVPTSAQPKVMERIGGGHKTRRLGVALMGSVLLLIPTLAAGTAEAAPGDFGAIAYSPSTQVSSFGSGGSAADAEGASVAGCRSQGGSDCAAYVWVENGFASLARSSDSFGTGWGTTAANAQSQAIQVCQQHGGSNCIEVFSAHTSDTPDNSPGAHGGPVSSPPTPTPVKANCQIDVRTTAVLAGGRHLYVVYTDPKGATYHYEAYPSNWPVPTGTVHATVGPGSRPRVGPPPNHDPLHGERTVVASGSAACGKDVNGNDVSGFGQRVAQGPHRCFLGQSSRIEQAKISYGLLTTNSNAYVYTILRNCGITPVKPTGDLETPGWGRLLIGS